MNRRWVGCLISFLALTTAGGYTFSLVAATPEEALRRPFSCPGQPNVEAKSFQVLTTRKWDKGVVAVYRGVCPNYDRPSFVSEKKDTVQMLSYRAVKRIGMEWHLSSSGSHRQALKKSQTDASTLIDYGVSHSSGKKIEKHTVLYGQVLSPQVSAIEATFNNGKTLRDESPDGMFALVARGATGVCDIRVLGYDNQILQREELISSKSAGSKDGNTCHPISGQL
ncbi:MAG: hypothetical protein HC780_21345 [Leptolyngbyaceae cyanobacterium CSU_1_3]|nr:hypothetical protein [Leptolyngbyaceae cyanobacterium CSU_1_3]